ncbi:LamG domain-containing protein [Microbispora cellulosiformans]|uniref:LamG domain-containing protein n=1 Tax=Microbispora cellulosiformans TaxID=2614688 RepID=A0A5J5K790_9ACTN|nr:LamG domain-containing protein [Microbispora cellulosiformans]KAA9380654.1 LamG domain-containing protein [Microbispora cellulosiformans]
MSANLILHWPLDEMSGQRTVFDASGNGILGQVSGDAKAVPDEQFGSALAFTGSGQYVTPAGGRGMTVPRYTVELWVRTDKPPAAAIPLVNRRNSVDLVINVNPDGSVEHRFVTQESIGNTHTTPPGLLSWNTWQHIAVTNDAATARIYVNGEAAAEWDYPGTRQQGDPTPLVVGADLARKVYTAGRYAHVRVYDGALTAAEIQRDMAEDSSTLAAYVRTHPLDLELLNLDEQPVLFIDNDPAGQPMRLRLTNSSRQNIEFLPQGATPGPANFHVAARLRPGVLATPAAVSSGASGWAAQAAADGTALYLVAANAAPIAPGAWVDVPLTGLSADPGGGSRGTRIEFDYQRLRSAGETAELTGTRLQYLDVVNHRGRPDIPLVMGFAAGDTVLNDGVTRSTLTLYVANTSTDTTVTLAGGGPGKGGSLFTVTFDVGADGNDWALAESVAGVSVTATAPGTSTASWGQVAHDLGTRASWTLYPTAGMDLAPGKAVVITVAGVVGLRDPGRAGIVVGYENIPGYRDGAQTLEADRRPLAFSGSSTGVGTLAPAAKLHVSDTVLAPTTNGTLLIGPPAAASLKIGYGADHAWLQSGPNAVLSLNPASGRVIVGATSTTTVDAGSKLTVVAAYSHLQLRRTAGTAGSGTQVFLELYQEQQSATVYPAIRFHQSNKFWHLIEGRPEGLFFRFAGDTTSMTDVYAAGLKGSSLTLGGTTIGEAELQILRRLAAGTLTVTLYNDEIRATASPFQIQNGTARPYVVGLEQPNQYNLMQRFRLVPVSS